MSGGARRAARQRSRASEPAEGVLHEHVGRVLGRRPFRGAHSHHARRQVRSAAAGERPRLLPDRRAARAGAVPDARQPGTAAGQSTRISVDAARAAGGDDEVGEGRNRAAGEPGSAPRRTARSSRRTASRSRRFPRRRVAEDHRGRHARTVTSLPLLVPQVDADGNEICRRPHAGAARPDGHLHRLEFPQRARSAATIRSSTCWDPRSRSGDESRPRSKVGDPRKSVAERYPSKAAYTEAARAVAEALVKGGYCSRTMCRRSCERMDQQWEHATAAPESTAAR